MSGHADPHGGPVHPSILLGFDIQHLCQRRALFRILPNEVGELFRHTTERFQCCFHQLVTDDRWR